MTKRTFLLLVLGLSACLCWAITGTVADDQPGARPDADSVRLNNATEKAEGHVGQTLPTEARRVAPMPEQIGRAAGSSTVQTLRTAERFGAAEYRPDHGLTGGFSRSSGHRAGSAKPLPVEVPPFVVADEREGRGGGRALADCTGLSDYAQPFDNANFGTARTSDEQAGIAVAEDLVDAGGVVMPMLTAPVTTIRWWGISLEFDPTVPGFVAFCGQDDAALTPYIFKFYTGTSSGPGVLRATRQAAPTSIVDTGTSFSLGANVMEYTATIDPPVCHEDITWISIQRKTGAHAANGNPCYFLWVDEDLVGSYDDAAYQDGLVETDQTICIGVFEGSTVGACCNETGAAYQVPDGPEIPNYGCAEGIDLCDCAQPGLRFSTGDCDTGFTPACGYGACCYLDNDVQTCVEVTETECTTLGGYRFRIGQECPEDISIFCYPPPANDTCATAIDYVACPTNFDSTGAETDVLLTDPPADLGFQPQNDVYFKYQIPASGAYSPAYTDGLIVITTYGSDFDTCIACYQNSTDTNCPNFDCNDLQILDTGAGQSDGVNDDMVSGLRYTSIARLKVSQFGTSGLKPGDCVLIRVAGLPSSSSATPPGGQGVLRVDFLPYIGEDASTVGVCCLPAGCQIQRSANAAADCRTAGGWFRQHTDFVEGAPAPTYDTGLDSDPEKLAGCCSTYPCEQGDFAGNPYVLPAFVQKDVPVTMTVNRHNVTYFQFQTPLVIGETAAVSIDTCGTPFDTILSIYRYNQPTDLDDAGDVHGGMEVGDEHTETPLFRNDNCWGVDPQASCFSDPDSLDSCMCLTVGEGADLTTTTWYIVKVGMKDERALAGGYVRADGIDPVANWPYDPEVPVTITLTWHDECVVCLTDCCKGDMDNSEMSDMADVPIFVDAVLRRGAFAGGLECDQWAFCTADMNNDYQVNGEDIEDFMFAVIYGWDCTPDQINCMDEDPDYCQIRNGGTFTPSDLKSGGENHYTVVDNFSSLSGGYINQICWWGVFMTFDGGWTGDCGPGSGTFRITYFNDAGGIPGTVKAGPFNVTPTQTVVDSLNFGTYTADEYMMDATHPLVGIGRDECVWVEIAADNGAGTCFFLWESAWPGDEVYYQDADSNGYQLADREAGDQAFCVNALLNQFACLDTECDPECPGGDAIIEGETGLLDPCSNDGHVDTVNGGCNSNPTTPPLIEITCDSIVCGTAGTWTQLGDIECDTNDDCPEGETCSGGTCTGGPYEFVYRDTDWYTLTLAEEQEITLTVATGDVDFPYVIGFVTGTNCTDPNLAISPYASKLPCQPASVAACLPAGEHWIFFAPRTSWLIGCEREYVFSVSCRDCPYCQYPNGSWVSVSDDAFPNWNADNFRPSEPGGITSVSWYGINMINQGGWVPCTFTQETYTVRYYLDDGSGSQGYAGLPGSFLVEHVIGANFTKEDTGSLFNDAPIYKYTATHPMVPVNAGQCYWVSVAQDADGQSCWYMWHSNSPGSDGQGDGVSAQSNNSGASWTPGDAEVGEFAWCVNVAAEPEGCGVDVAACCVEGECIGDLSEYYCVMALGTWHEGESCDTFICPQPVECYANSLTYSVNPNLLEDMPYSCAIHAEEHNVDNFFARSYTNVSARYVNCVHFGVWSTEATPLTMRIRVYRDANGGFPDSSMTVCGTSFVPIPPNTSNAFFTAYYSPSAYVAAGGKMVVEEFYPESDAYLFIGANTAGSTPTSAHSYWKSPCFDDAWIDMQTYGDAGIAAWHLVQRVRWSTTP